MNFRKITFKAMFGTIMTLMLLMVGFTSCNKEETTDNTSFVFHYTSLSDISPTMTGTIASPTYKGAKPSGFAITAITYGEENEKYEGNSFVINEEDGSIAITETQELKVGIYKISVSCQANGHTYYNDNAVVVNFMKPVPDEIKMEPAEISVEYTVLKEAEAGYAELPTSQITTDGNHITILGYEISSVKRDGEVIDITKDCPFIVSPDGVVSFNVGHKELAIGKFTLSFRVKTSVAGSEGELGLFSDALTVNITSKPLDLVYDPAIGRLEEMTTAPTSYRSQIPTVSGSLDDLEFSIESVTSTDESGKEKIKIDSKTGEIYIEENHGLTKGNKYQIDIRVKNRYCPEGVVFENRFELDVVNYIVPIDLNTFNYSNLTGMRVAKFNFEKDPSFVGADPIFSFESLPEGWENQLMIDPATGEIKVKDKNHTLTPGDYPIKVKVVNDKNLEGLIKEFTIHIVENPNYFRYLSYGEFYGSYENHPQSQYDNQFQFDKKEDVKTVLDGKTPDLGIVPQSGQFVKYEILNKYNAGGISIDEKTGKLTIGDIAYDKHINYIIIQLTLGNNEVNSYSKKVPVFFNFCDPIKTKGAKDKNAFGTDGTATIKYKPFVIHVNPNDNVNKDYPGATVTFNPTSIDHSKLLMDFSRTFVYNNINGTYANGTPLESGNIEAKSGETNPYLQKLWGEMGCLGKYGSRDPVSVVLSGSLKDAKTLATKNLMYVDLNDNFKIKVNNSYWKYEGCMPDGIFTAQMTFNNGNIGKIKDGCQSFPIAIWFDKDFQKE